MFIFHPPLRISHISVLPHISLSDSIFSEFLLIWLIFKLILLLLLLFIID